MKNYKDAEFQNIKNLYKVNLDKEFSENLNKAKEEIINIEDIKWPFKTGEEQRKFIIEDILKIQDYYKCKSKNVKKENTEELNIDIDFY